MKILSREAEMKHLAHFVTLNLKFALQQVACGQHAVAQHIAYADEHRLFVMYHTAVRIDVDLAVSECI